MITCKNKFKFTLKNNQIKKLKYKNCSSYVASGNLSLLYNNKNGIKRQKKTNNKLMMLQNCKKKSIKKF